MLSNTKMYYLDLLRYRDRRMCKATVKRWSSQQVQKTNNKNKKLSRAGISLIHLVEFSFPKGFNLGKTSIHKEQDTKS